MEKYLDNTPGSESVLGLMNDIDGKVKLLIDREVLNERIFRLSSIVLIHQVSD